MKADDGSGASLLEHFMPRFDTRSQHAIEVHAPAQDVFAAVEAVTVKEVRFLPSLSSYAQSPAWRRLGTRRADRRRTAGS